MINSNDGHYTPNILERSKKIILMNSQNRAIYHKSNEMPTKEVIYIHEISDDDSEEPEQSIQQTSNQNNNLKHKNGELLKNCYSTVLKKVNNGNQFEQSTTKFINKESALLPLQYPDGKSQHSEEIIDLESLSSCKNYDADDDIADPNCLIKTSSDSSSELIISSQSASFNNKQRTKTQFNNSTVRPMLKNTIPADCLQKFLACLEKKFTKLSSRDKVLSWEFSSDVSDVEDVIDFEEKRNLLKLRYRNNNFKSNELISSEHLSKNSKSLRSSVKKQNKIDNFNDLSIIENNFNIKSKKFNALQDEKMFKLNNSSPKMSPSSTNSGWSTDYGKDDKINNSITICSRTNENIIKTSHKLIQIRMDYASKLNRTDIFKIPNVPRKYLPINNKMCACDKKEEFCKYLGLETKSPENEISVCTDTAAELKRRSLRVRRLQLEQKIKNIKKLEQNMQNEKVKNSINDGDLIKKPNGCIGLDAEPKIKIICSVTSNTINNKNMEKPSEGLTLAKKRNKINMPARTTPRKLPRWSNSSLPEKPNEISNSNPAELKKNNIKHNSTRVNSIEQNNLETSADRLISNNHSEDDLPESLIVVKRSYQQSPLPIKQNHFKINNTKILQNETSENHLKINYRNKMKHFNEGNLDEKKIKIEYSTNYGLKTNGKLFGIEKSCQTRCNNIQLPVSVKESSLEASVTVPNNAPFSSSSPSPTECKVVIEKLQTDQLKKEINNFEVQLQEKNNLLDVIEYQKIPASKPRNIISKKHLKIWNKSKKLKIRHVNLKQSRILRSRNFLKTIKKPIKIKKSIKKLKKERKISENSLNVKDSKLTITMNSNDNDGVHENKISLKENIDDIKVTVQIENNSPKKTEPTDSITKELNPSSKRINEQSLELTHNFLPNPLKFEKGDVIHAYFECDFLIVVQEFSISFWKYSKVIQMLGESQEWEMLGECKRKLIDEEIFSPYKNRMCVNDSNPVYIELRARQLPNANRECNLASPYINVYYFDVWKDCVAQHSIQLDIIKCLSSFIAYTTIVNSRYFVMCWKQDTILGTHRTGICKYSLTPDLDTLASIREFKNLRHTVFSLDCCDSDKLIGFGETQITIWDHRTGDVLTNFDLGIPIGKNLGSLMSSIEFEKYLFLYQLSQNDETDDLPELKIIAITISLNTPSFRLIYSHELPLQFNVVKSSFNTEDYCIITALTGEEIWMLPHHPQRLLHMDKEIATSSKRFYSTSNAFFIEITGDYLNVKKIHENLLNIFAK